jgi:hypothetical protein
MHIKRLIERFLRDKGLPPTKFGRLAARDPRLVLDIRMGREIRPEMEEKLRAFMCSYCERPNAQGRERP